MIVARADNGVIGRDGTLPWHIPADLKRFKVLTATKPMIMGRRTFESLPGLLPGRRHIVLTRGDWTAPGAEIAHDVETALALAGDDAAVIGGAAVFVRFSPLADVYEVTEVHDAPQGDVFLPPPDPAMWNEVARTSHPGYSFVTYRRRG